MATILLIPLLTPDAKQTDELLTEDKDSATKGSLLRKWFGEPRYEVEDPDAAAHHP